MLTEAITRRFSKHHSRVLAYMDAVEEIAKDLTDAEQPAQLFETSRDLLFDCFDFLINEESQHELEEEKILLPALETRIMQSSDAPPEVPVERVCEEHDQGRRLLADLHRHLLHLDGERPSEPVEYYQFASSLLDLVWHFRRHVWAENSEILPVASRLIPDHSDQLWSKSISRKS